MTSVDVVEILRRLIQFDTSNPPGRERACVDYLDRLLSGSGFETQRVARDPERPNLLTRLPGKGEAPPLLMYGHVDVVGADEGKWTHPPFGGVLEDGWVWGRGALDMKGGVAMMVAALLQARAAGTCPAGDVVLAILSDEEAGGEYGARYLAEGHPELFDGIRWAIGEFGGFPLYLDGQTFYPIQIAEKGVCWLEARIPGRGAHGSLPQSGGTMAELSAFLDALDGREPRWRITEPVAEMIERMAEVADPPLDATVRALLDPAERDRSLEALGEDAALFDAVLRNTANATVVRAGEKVNVVPAEARVRIDGRTLPGQTPDDLLEELTSDLGEEIEFRVLREDAGTDEADLTLFPLLAGLLTERDPDVRPFPLVLFGGTDGRFFSRLGIQTYGYLPMRLPEEFQFMETVHSADERIPVASLEFGTGVLTELLSRYGGEVP